MSRISALALVAFLWSPTVPAQAPSHFPEGVFSADPASDRATAEILDRYLTALHEPNLAESASTDEVYRLIWIRPFDPAVVVRIVQGQQAPVVHTGIADPYRDSTPVISSSTLSEEAWLRLQAAIRRSGYWTSMANHPLDPDFTTIDAPYWIIEGRADRRYRFVQRVPPFVGRDDAFIDLSTIFLKLSGLDLGDLGISGISESRSPPRMPSGPSVQEPQSLSILQITLDCDAYDGGRVTIMGAATLTSGRRAICPTLDFLRADPLNCLWLSLETLEGDTLKALARKVGEGRYVYLEARVRCDVRGWGPEPHGGSLEDLTVLVDDESGEVLWEADE